MLTSTQKREIAQLLRRVYVGVQHAPKTLVRAAELLDMDAGEQEAREQVDREEWDMRRRYVQRLATWRDQDHG